MSNFTREFDSYSSDYEDLLRDPLRDRFSSGAGSAFFHTRKQELILDYWASRKVDTHSLSYLDLGCGKGDLLSLLRPSFGKVAGCDPSPGMISDVEGIDVRIQQDPGIIPFDNKEFDFVTAVCVYHHVPPAERARLTLEVKRVLKPGGVFCIIEHNPFNPVTRAVVKRTPVDENAILLRSFETKKLLRDAGLPGTHTENFLFVPASLYGKAGRFMEKVLIHVPLGGQYAVFGTQS